MPERKEQTLHYNWGVMDLNARVANAMRHGLIVDMTNMRTAGDVEAAMIKVGVKEEVIQEAAKCKISGCEIEIPDSIGVTEMRMPELPKEIANVPITPELQVVGIKAVIDAFTQQDLTFTLCLRCSAMNSQRCRFIKH